MTNKNSSEKIGRPKAKLPSRNKIPLAPEYRHALWVLTATASVGAIALGVWMNMHPAKPSPIVACTMEAKVCPDGSTVGRSGPQCAFAPCPGITNTSSSLPGAREKFVNSTLKYHVTLPTGWYLRSEGGSRIDPASASTQRSNFIAPSDNFYSAPALTIRGAATDSLNVYPQTVAQWKGEHDYCLPIETPITIGNATGVQEEFNSDSCGRSKTILVTRGSMFYQIQVGAPEDTETQAMLKTLVFELPAKIAPAAIPFTAVHHFNLRLQDLGDADIHALSLMGDSLLVGGQASLLGLYDLRTGAYSSLTSKLPQDAQAASRAVGAIANNGQFWVAATNGPDGIRLWKVEGQSVQEIASPKTQVTDNPTGFTPSLAWNGSTWLLGDYYGDLFEGNLTSFTDLSARVQEARLGIGSTSISTIVPDGNGWRLAIDGDVYRFANHVLTKINMPGKQAIGGIFPHGNEWLYIASDGSMLTEKSSVVTDSRERTQPYAYQAAWMKTMWFTGGAFFDAKKAVPFNGSFSGFGAEGVSTFSEHYAFFGGRGGQLSGVSF